MDEYVRRIYHKEEEFLEEYLGTVEAALPSIPVEWQPNYSCNEQVRTEIAQRLRAGTLQSLTFEDAVIFCNHNGLSCIGIYLRSSERYVVIDIRFVGGKVTVEKRGDKATPPRPGRAHHLAEASAALSALPPYHRGSALANPDSTGRMFGSRALK